MLLGSDRVGYTAPSSPTAAVQDVPLHVGIVQRFGRKPSDTLMLQAQGGKLTFRFLTNGQTQTVSSSTAKLDIVMQPLPQPLTEERVVLSTHRSFESAEDNANFWRQRGIPVELAQPDRWQVWAKRDVYNSPVVRRLLLQSIQAQGVQTAYIDTKTLTQQPKASLVVNGFRYTRDAIDILPASSTQVTTNGPEGTKRLYAGSLRLQPNAYGTYTLVNVVPIETYLRGVVPNEIGAWAPQPVLEVQAILARTYALRNVRRFAIDNYQICADTQCQVYYGLTGAAPQTDRAIATTRSLVLTYANELVDAVYSSANGGVTAAFNDVWQGPNRPYLRTIVDSVGNPWDLSRYPLTDERNFRTFIGQKKGFNEEKDQMFRWREVSRLTDLNQELRELLTAKRHPLANFTTIQNLQVTQRAPSGRVLKLTVTTDRGPIELDKDAILIAFKAPNSTLFYIEPVREKQALKGFAFVGGGLGHGVGLSQTGTYHLGELGWPSDRILGFYFPGTQLQPISSAITIWRDSQPKPTGQQASPSLQ